MARNENRIPPRGHRKSEADSAFIWRWLKRIKTMVSFTFSLMLLGGICLFIALLYLRSQALPVASITQTTQIYDINGQVMHAIHSGQNRQVVPLGEISPYVVQATLAIEDHRFYQHFGIDPKGLARAILVDLRHMSKVQGASTLTQQLARNLYLNHDRTWSRKLKEALYTLQLEMHLSKDDILEMYLNQIYYGHSTYGIEAAAQMFFHKSASELTLAEGSLLAGVPKGPAFYSPYLNMDNARSRQRLILQAMVRQGFVTEEEAREAEQEELVIMPRSAGVSAEAPYFRDYIRQLAVHELGFSEEQLVSGGLRIYTTLDLRMQRIAEEVVREQLAAEEELQTALIAIDPRNGHIKAMVGGRSYQENQYNRVFATTRQPGSAFKPIVYLTALRQHAYTPVSQVKSEPTVFEYDNGRQRYMPSNFANNYSYDYIDMRRAIAQSDNIYAVHTMMEVGAENVIETARSLGISSPMQPLPSLALGTYPVSPYEMAIAFATIANQGVRSEPVAILRIEDDRGKVLYEAKPRQEQVIEPEYTYVLTSLMESVFEQGGTGSRVSSLLKRQVAGKTGTTNSDAWMVGYTPELATAVWLGYDRGRTIGNLQSRIASPIFAEFTERALEPIPPKLFPIPDNVVSLYVDPVSGKLATDQCGARLEVFVRGTEPAEYCSETGIKLNESSDPQSVQKKQTRSWWEDLKRWWTE